MGSTKLSYARFCAAVTVVFLSTTISLHAGDFPGFVYSEKAGAKCDGVNDDTAAFQKAFDQLQQGGGGILLIPPATCVIDGTVTIDPVAGDRDVVVMAHGVTLNVTGLDYGFRVAPSGTHPRLPRLIWYGGRVVGTDMGAGAFRLENSGRATFRDVTITGFANGSGFDLVNTTAWSENNTFSGLRLSNLQYGFRFMKDGGKGSFARTRIYDLVGSGLGYWVWVAPDTGVYDSSFEMFGGNLGRSVSQAVFHLAGGMRGSSISNIKVEAQARTPKHAVVEVGALRGANLVTFRNIRVPSDMVLFDFTADSTVSETDLVVVD